MKRAAPAPLGPTEDDAPEAQAKRGRLASSPSSNVESSAASPRLVVPTPISMGQHHTTTSKEILLVREPPDPSAASSSSAAAAGPGAAAGGERKGVKMMSSTSTAAAATAEVEIKAAASTSTGSRSHRPPTEAQASEPGDGKVSPVQKPALQSAVGGGKKPGNRSKSPPARSADGAKRPHAAASAGSVVKTGVIPSASAGVVVPTTGAVAPAIAGAALGPAAGRKRTDAGATTTSAPSQLLPAPAAAGAATATGAGSEQQKTSGRKRKRPFWTSKLPDGTRVSSNRPTKNFKELREQQASFAAAPPANANANLTRDAKKLFSYGNFDTHYSCRSDRFQTIDARLLILLKYLQLGDTKHYTGDVFFGKRVLDVGCGIGCNAFALAGFLNASYVLGVDVDLKCMQTALKQLRKVKQDGVAFYEAGVGEQRPPRAPTIAGVRMARPAEVEKSAAGGGGEEQEEAAGGLLNQALFEEVGADLRRTSAFPKCLVQTRSVIPYVQKPYLLSEEPPLVRKKSDFDFPYNIEFRTEDVCAPDSSSTLMGFADLVHDYNLLSGKGNAAAGDFHSGSAAAARSSRTPKSRGGTTGAVSFRTPPRTPPAGSGAAAGVQRRQPTKDRRLPRESPRELQQQALLREQVVDPRFDTILLFSVVKFVHTNHGDAGLEMLFDRCYELLKPGGVLVLEYAPWREYGVSTGGNRARQILGDKGGEASGGGGSGGGAAVAMAAEQGGTGTGSAAVGTTTAPPAGENFPVDDAVEENEKVNVKKKKHQTEVMRSVILPELKHRPEDFKQLLCGRDGERFVNVQVVHKDQFPDLTRSLYLFTKKK